MGNAYPTPGLTGKFYDADMEPLVEVVRDTVGRHDTFALACNAKYYEDMGYPGHVNCTDNFNEALVPFEIRRRRGWPALNLFFNTSFSADNVLVSDEPWSRPGDYVLLRAMTDLVCASSACPDDIDPANAWDPTDVHVRVYAPDERFSAAIAHRLTPDSSPDSRRTPAFRPRWGRSPATLRSTRATGSPPISTPMAPSPSTGLAVSGAAVMDLSPLRKFEILGPDAESLTASGHHARRSQAVGRPGRLHVALQRPGRTRRRVHGVPAGRGQLPLGGRSRHGGPLAEGAGRRGRIRERLRQGLDRSAPQHRGPGTRQPRHRPTVRLDATDPARTRGARMVPLPDRDGSANHREHRSSSRGPVTRASSATRSSATRATRRRLGRCLGRRARPAASRPSASTRSTCSGSRRA